MATLGPTAFGIVLWGVLLGVAVVFGYELYVIGTDAGWRKPGRR